MIIHHRHDSSYSDHDDHCHDSSYSDDHHHRRNDSSYSDDDDHHRHNGQDESQLEGKIRVIIPIMIYHYNGCMIMIMTKTFSRH